MKTDYDILKQIIELSKDEDTEITTYSYFSVLCQTFIKQMETQKVYYINKLNIPKNQHFLRDNIKTHIDLFSKGRFVDYFSRVSINDGKCSYNVFYPNKTVYLRDNQFINLISFQGKCWGSIVYRDLNLYKTHFDYSLYPMIIQELKPKTIPISFSSSS